MNSNDFVINTEGLSKSFGEVHALQSLTLQVSDISMELPDIPGMTFQPRPDDMMPMPNIDYGTVVV